MKIQTELFCELNRWSLPSRIILLFGVPAIFFLTLTASEEKNGSLSAKWEVTGASEENLSSPAFASQFNYLGPLPSQSISSILTRPLFSPTRRPPETHPQEPQERIYEEPEVEDEFRFVGTLRSHSSITAFVIAQPSNNIIRLLEGEYLRGWKIISINMDTIEITKKNQSKTLRIFECNNCAPA